MQKVKLIIKGLSYSERQSGAYALLMAEANGQRKLPIVIGGFEAQSIAIALEKAVSPPRPLTHDLFIKVLNEYAITLLEVVIHRIKDGVFYASLITSQNGVQQVVDARPSDAVALAVRCQCPIYTTDEVLNKAGMILDEEHSGKNIVPDVEADLAEDVAQKPINPLSNANLSDLNEWLQKAVANEDYEKAARIRDEIDKRNKK